MAQRVPVAETNFFAIVIAIQGQAGGNLSEALGNLSRVLRERKKMKAKIGAMSMEAKASAVIIGLVPFLVVGALYVSAPKYVSALWTTHARAADRRRRARLDGDRGRDDAENGRFRHLRGGPIMMRDRRSRRSSPIRARLAMLCVLAAAAAAALVLGRAPWLRPDPLARRIKAVGAERERIRAREREKLTAAEKRSALRMRPSGLVKQLVERLDLMSWLGTETAKAQLAMAGYRGAGAEYAFLAFRLAAPIVLLRRRRRSTPSSSCTGTSRSSSSSAWRSRRPISA